MTYLVRPMQDEDIPQVLQIDREAFPTQWPYPSYASFKDELRNRIAHYMVAYEKKGDSQGVAAQTKAISFWQKFFLVRAPKHSTPISSPSPTPSAQQLVVGYAGFWIMMDEAHLTTIAVRKAYQRRGIGELLFISVIDLATQLNARTITLEVRVSNRPAQSLYEKYDFKPVGTRRRYYSDNGEDALIMTAENIVSPSFRARFLQLKQAHQQKWGEGFAYTHLSGDENGRD